MNKTLYEKYLQIVKKITNNDERCYDLLHDVIISLSSNEKYNNLDDKQKIFFFVRTFNNQFRSNNSKFQRTYRKYYYDVELTNDKPDEEYSEAPTLDWINERLDMELEERPDRWYEIGLFKLYIKYEKITLIHKQTRIPKYSIRNTLKEMKDWLKEEWIKYKANADT